MGLQLNHVLVLVLLWFLQTSNAKLMYVNGVQQKDLTPVKLHDIDALVFGLEMFKKVASRGTNADAKRQEGGAKIPYGNQTEATNNTNSNLQIHAVPKLSNDTHMDEEVSKLNSSEIDIPSKIGENRLERGGGAMFDVMGHIQTLLMGVMRINVSKPNIFITNFALKHTDDTDLNH